MITPILSSVLALVALAYCVKIGVSDFQTQKIRNPDVYVLLVLGTALHAAGALYTGQIHIFTISALTSIAVFAALFVFWMAKKLGAGDVKYMAVALFLVHPQVMLLFMVSLLISVLITSLVMKFPVMLPERAFRAYITGLAESGRVPFGVPISAATVIALAASVAMGSWLSA